MIVFEGVTKRFGNRVVLEDVSFEIRPGEFVSIVGPSGAGKTTLIKLILGDERPTEGAVFANNVDLRGIQDDDLQRYRRNIGAIFQDYKLLPGKTVFENVAFALSACEYPKTDIPQLVAQALESAGISHLREHFPHELSGGEAQRAALARATVHKPKLILADEPTGNLDSENARQVVKNLLKINMEGATVLLTTHNRPLVDLIGQKVLRIDRGRLT